MANDKPTNIREVLENAGYVIWRIAGEWSQIQINRPGVETGAKIGDIFGKDDKDVSVYYQERDSEQISAALDLRDVLEQNRIPYREYPSREQTVYDLASYIPRPSDAHNPRVIVAKLRRRADLVERLTQESQYLRRK